MCFLATSSPVDMYHTFLRGVGVPCTINMETMEAHVLPSRCY
jgi:hypothetical protein